MYILCFVQQLLSTNRSHDSETNDLYSLMIHSEIISLLMSFSPSLSVSLFSLMHEWSLTQVKRINSTFIFTKERRKSERITVLVNTTTCKWENGFFLYLDTLLLAYWRKMHHLSSKQKTISLRRVCACAYSSFFLWRQYPIPIKKKKADKYTDFYIASKTHILTQFIIKRTTNKCRLIINMHKGRDSSIVNILVCRWRERLM
jgi:hypothetical protein